MTNSARPLSPATASPEQQGEEGEAGRTEATDDGYMEVREEEEADVGQGAPLSGQLRFRRGDAGRGDAGRGSVATLDISCRPLTDKEAETAPAPLLPLPVAETNEQR